MGKVLTSPLNRKVGTLGAQTIGQVGARTFSPSVSKELGDEGQQGYTQNNYQQSFQQGLPPIPQSITQEQPVLSPQGQWRWGEKN